MNIQVEVKDIVLKSIETVFDAIISPDKITKYFPSHSSGEMLQGNKIIWKFEDVGVELYIDVLKVEKNNYLSFEWSASGTHTTVEINLDAKDENQTIIEIMESSFEMNAAGVKKALQQTQGWTDFICSLKAYLYTGINLRNGRSANTK